MNTLVILQNNSCFPISHCAITFDAMRKLALEYEQEWLDAGFSQSPVTGSYIKGKEWRRAILVDDSGLSWSLTGQGGI